MRVVGLLLAGCVAIALAQQIAMLLCVALVVLFVWGILFRLRQTMCLTILLLGITHPTPHPWIWLCVLGVGEGLLLLRRIKKGQGGQEVLPPPESRPPSKSLEGGLT